MLKVSSFFIIKTDKNLTLKGEQSITNIINILYHDTVILSIEQSNKKFTLCNDCSATPYFEEEKNFPFNYLKCIEKLCSNSGTVTDA